MTHFFYEHRTMAEVMKADFMLRFRRHMRHYLRVEKDRIWHAKISYRRRTVQMKVMEIANETVTETVLFQADGHGNLLAIRCTSPVRYILGNELSAVERFFAEKGYNITTTELVAE